MKYKAMLNAFKQTAVSFLVEHAEVLGNRSCNDWEWPPSWTDGERREFAREYIRNNENRANPSISDVEYFVEHGLPDHAACSMLAHMLAQDAGVIDHA